MGPPQPGARKRRLHRKSRLGCLECKKRHMKCDEGQPSCTNCNTAERTCRYASLAPPRGRTGSRSPSAIPAPGVPPPTPAAGVDWMRNLEPGPAPNVGSEHTYNLEHMRLLHHIEQGVNDWLEVTEAMRPVASIYLAKAFTAPYCMDQLLALSALHLSATATSDTAGDPRHLHYTATNLQTRALAGFRRAMECGAEDATATFVFSSLISVHVLAERLVGNRHDFGAFLDGVVDHFRHHRGACIMGNAYWADFGGAELIAKLTTWGGVPSPASACEGGETPGRQDVWGEPGEKSVLAAIIGASALNEASAQACLQAIRSLEEVDKRLEGHDAWGVHILLGWHNMIPLEFINLLERRVPEALVILAHFAGYLHQHRHFWVFGDAGGFLFRGIARHLGRHWMGWMREPMEVVTGSVESPGDGLGA